jgi:PilZ domain
MIPEDKAAGPDCNRVSGERRGVTLLCEVRQSSRPWQMVQLEDLSQTGFRIAWIPGANKHIPLRIRIPGMQVLSAHIRWQEGNAIGCEFTAPLYIAVFDHIVRSGNPG